MKTCRQCGLEKRRTEFNRFKRSPDGLQGYCKSCQSSVHAEWRKQNEQHLRAYREENRDYNNAVSKKWRQDNIDKDLENKRRYYQANKNAVLARTSEYRKNNKALYQVAKRNYYTRKKQNGGDLTEDEWMALCAACEFRCLCCGEAKPLEIDHIVPVSKGGNTSLGNAQPLCRSCNASKSDKEIDYRTDAIHSFLVQNS